MIGSSRGLPRPGSARLRGRGPVLTGTGGHRRTDSVPGRPPGRGPGPLPLAAVLPDLEATVTEAEYSLESLFAAVTVRAATYRSGLQFIESQSRMPPGQLGNLFKLTLPIAFSALPQDLIKQYLNLSST
eukprot:757736-Hanusia_phi.AAC.7